MYNAPASISMRREGKETTRSIIAKRRKKSAAHGLAGKTWRTNVFLLTEEKKGGKEKRSRI